MNRSRKRPIACAPPIGTSEMPAASVSTSRRSASASIATRSLVPSTRIAARGLELKGREIQPVLALDRGEGDREVLDREARRVEGRGLLVSPTPLRLTGENRAELGHAASLEPAGLDRVHELAVVARLLPVVGENPAAQQLVDGDLSLARTVRAHEAHVLTGTERALREQHFMPGRDGHQEVGRERLGKPDRLCNSLLRSKLGGGALRAFLIDVMKENVSSAREERPGGCNAVDAHAD